MNIDSKLIVILMIILILIIALIIGIIFLIIFSLTESYPTTNLNFYKGIW